MPDDKPIVPLTDEAIDNLTSYVEAAEILAQAMGLPVSKAYRFMLKSTQAMARMQQKGKDITSMFTKGVQ